MLGVDACEFGGQVLELLWLTMCYRGLMADKNELAMKEEEEEEEETNLGYTPPAPKSLKEIQEQDKDDESLLKYKQMLLGDPLGAVDASLPWLQVLRIALLCDEAPEPIVMDLSDLAALKKTVLVMKEGATFRLKIYFKVNREIISGLRYHHVMKRQGISVGKKSYMIGSYGPKLEVQEFESPTDEAPKGLMSLGRYLIRSRVIDDDKNVHLQWEWNLDVKKSWD
ncbi:rho GDP-dissociation inhibitor 2-like [Takifugu flavidus]|uniref:Rho GDP-dissociation inhibitor 3 n=1 Tax=Takifugu flavidus TaxID=433684 RepID=A0A5C6NSN2_9TELE|nr:rho GDP-dissociation inhibitor 2-like [Takifugu flavidus]TWW69591.1 Rho GDP-dissociation inhibitor 3 [Takifugu flavidus]